MQVINFATPVSLNGHHFPGVTVHNGVSVGQKPYPCDNTRMSVDFSGCKEDTSGLYVDFVDFTKSVEFSDNANPHYLQLNAAQ